jgi:hypothetical protein
MWTVRVQSIDHGESIELNSMLFENPQTVHHAGKRRLATLVQAIGIVNFLRSIDRKPNKKIIPRKKLTPGIVKQCPVGLKSVVDDFAVRVLLMQLNDLLEKRNPQQRRLAALPGKANILCGLQMKPTDCSYNGARDASSICR